jgi:hypothetical protein
MVPMFLVTPAVPFCHFSFVRYTIRHLVELPAFQGYAASVSMTPLVPHLGPFQGISQSIDLVSPTLLFLWPRVRSKEKVMQEHGGNRRGSRLIRAP